MVTRDTNLVLKKPYYDPKHKLLRDDSGYEGAKFFTKLDKGESTISRKIGHLVKASKSFSDDHTQSVYGSSYIAKPDLPKLDCPIPLETLLDMYYGPKTMDANNKLTRSDTGLRDIVTKDISKLAECPEVYVVQVMRFRDTSAKVTTPVQFKESLELNSLNGSAKYELYAVGNHEGGASLSSGHYFAFVKSLQDGQWYKANDSHVRALDKSELFSERSFQSAYVLFYKRVKEGEVNSW